MMNIFSWQNPLRVNDAHMNQWKQEASGSSFSTFWCLKYRKINPQEYLIWARDHFGLPLLLEDYFQNYDFEFWNQIKSISGFGSKRRRGRRLQYN